MYGIFNRALNCICSRNVVYSSCLFSMCGPKSQNFSNTTRGPKLLFTRLPKMSRTISIHPPPHVTFVTTPLHLKCQELFERPLSAYFNFLSRTIKVGFWHNWTPLSRDLYVINSTPSRVATSVFVFTMTSQMMSMLFLLQKVIRGQCNRCWCCHSLENNEHHSFIAELKYICVRHHPHERKKCGIFWNMPDFLRKCHIF